ncbi:ribosome recycling factor [Lactarius vividus]|nr:ribosome recycling factor [Lactarius vividus]
MSLLRHGLRLHISPAASRLSPTVTLTNLVQRAYASKKAKHGSNVERATASSSKRGPITTTSLTPGSQQVLSDPAEREEHARASAAMASSVEWFRREVVQLETRASGRVTPQLLDPVRVSLSPATHEERETSLPSKVRLEELATVGVRDGSSLVVTVFEPQNLKHVQDALYDAKIQGVIPQRVDERTLRIPIPKPTVDARIAAYSTASKQAENARVQIRRQHQASVKRGKFPKHSIANDEVGVHFLEVLPLANKENDISKLQKLQDRHIAEVDAILARVKKSTGPR